MLCVCVLVCLCACVFVCLLGMIDYKYVGQDKKNYFRILDVGGQRTDRRKWIEHFAELS